MSPIVNKKLSLDLFILPTLHNPKGLEKGCRETGDRCFRCQLWDVVWIYHAYNVRARVCVYAQSSLHLFVSYTHTRRSQIPGSAGYVVVENYRSHGRFASPSFSHQQHLTIDHYCQRHDCSCEPVGGESVRQRRHRGEQLAFFIARNLSGQKGNDGKPGCQHLAPKKQKDTTFLLLWTTKSTSLLAAWSVGERHHVRNM